MATKLDLALEERVDFKGTAPSESNFFSMEILINLRGVDIAA